MTQIAERAGLTRRTLHRYPVGAIGLSRGRRVVAGSPSRLRRGSEGSTE
ncbi:hypothetical protein ACVV2G_10460 [Streptomyces ziwulingensis]